MSRPVVIPGSSVRRPVTCSRCKRVGHNKSNCKEDLARLLIGEFDDLPALVPLDYDSDDEEFQPDPVTRTHFQELLDHSDDSDNDSEDEEG